VTFPASDTDLPRPTISASPGSNRTFNVDYNIDGLLVGYKWYDANGITPQFPFGFGMSYTTFGFSNLAVTNNFGTQNPGVQVSFDLANTGQVAGAEVAQVYLALPDAAGDAPKRLVGWQKVFLQPGAKQHVTINVNANDSSHPFSVWDTSSGRWQIFPGDYVMYAGNSSAKQVLSVAGSVHLGQ
jgi:beta-glucosidase